MDDINRRKTPVANIGGVLMGSQHPIVVQSMTNTPTRDIDRTLAQVIELAEAGSELVRITINDMEAADAVPEMIKRLRDKGYNTPIIGDFHYNGHILLSKQKEMAQLIAKYRINPGNVGKGNKRDDNFTTMVKVAIDNDKPVRIGVNWGSIDQDLLNDLMDANAKRPTPKDFKEVVIDTMIKSAIISTELAMSIGLPKEKIVVSVKMSEIQDLLQAYQRLAKESDYILHVGLTEAGNGVKGITSSAAALGILLQQGIGDTIRVSLTPEPGLPRSREVDVCLNLLQTMGFRHFKPMVTSCPGCGRTDSDYFVHLAKDINDHIDNKIKEWKPIYPGIEKLKVAVMGCVVNGPGESKYADIGISIPGIRETPTAPVYIDGKQHCTLKGDNIRDEFMVIFDEYIQGRFGV